MSRLITVQANVVTESEESAARAAETLSRTMIGIALDGDVVGTGVTFITTEQEDEEQKRGG